ncbi:hypothetical protein [Streptosporangium roseum]|uniref:Gram-positive cocci surface proteins LPxTG domain-containing protein n=1 Tax=Streptosporangium roseum (strain ATCC 12428 / DSM 43021 / JCM 3005 / KCTC 9067 / NCIMB 10171 / NRRL 2505 / NI 9100) TaxID=479432 RepID=D2B770_STRRD|nr:hypothetical protein [Streptosporangium roseum]ACZ89595.1 hypothetical protein Sros_6892 [Streptosporangium roseum DSM 43021]
MQSTGVLTRWVATAGVAAVVVAGAAWPAAARGDDQEVRLSPYRVRPGQDIEIAAPACDGPAFARSAAFRNEVELGGPGFQEGAGFEGDGSGGFGDGFGDGPGRGFGDGFAGGPGDGFGDGFQGGPGDGFGEAPPVTAGWAQVDYDAPWGAYAVEVDCQGDTLYGELYVVDGSGPNTGGGGLALAGDAAARGAAAEEGERPAAVLGWGIGAAAVLAGAGGLTLMRRRRAAGRG